MGGRKSDSKIGGYKGVECQALERELSTDLPQKPLSFNKSINPFRVAGGAKISKSGQSLSIQVNDADCIRHFTVLLGDISNLIEERARIIKGENLMPNTISVREYDNSSANIQEN
jgi:hypothetical protein